MRVPGPFPVVILCPSLWHSEPFALVILSAAKNLIYAQGRLREESGAPLRQTPVGIDSAKNLSPRCLIPHRTDRPLVEFILSVSEGLRVTDCAEVDR